MLEICIILLKISVIKTIGEATGMTDIHRVTKVFGEVSKKMIGRENRKSEEEIGEVKQNVF